MLYLLLPRQLIILKTSSSENSIFDKVLFVQKNTSLGKELLFSMTEYYLAKKSLKNCSFLSKFITNLSSITNGGMHGILESLRNVFSNDQ